MINFRTAHLRVTRFAVAFAAGSALSACSGVGGPQSDSDFNKRIYAGGGVLVSQLEPDTDQVTGLSVDEKNSAGGALMLGYDLSNRFTIEGHVADLGEADLSPDGSVSYQVGGISGLVYGLNNRDNRIYREGFAAFGRLGVGGMANDADDVDFRRVNDAHLLIGAGLEYGFTNGLAARAEILGHDTDARYGQLALLYRFGSDSRRRSAQPVASRELPTPDEESTQVTPVPTQEASTFESAVVDVDLDGVTDDNDDCLNTDPGLPVDATGCEVFQGVIEGINFLSGSDELTDGALDKLANIARTLQEYPAIQLTIEAHTDNAGAAVDNLQLSRRRALSVARYLIEQGVLGSRLRPQAFGESQPRNTNATLEGRAANRRVEFSVIQ